jgi:dCTP deaminase
VILTGPEIRCRVANGEIVIDNFNEQQLNPNSYNLRLGHTLATYTGKVLDSRDVNPVTTSVLGPGGVVLQPGTLYLGHTMERTATPTLVPMLEGRSSLARLGLSVHQTGGVGDVGFDGQWVLEIACIHPVRIYPGMQICQILFFCPVGDKIAYKGRYQGQRGPVPSRLWQDAATS